MSLPATLGEMIQMNNILRDPGKLVTLGFIAEFDMFLDVSAVKMKIFDRAGYTLVSTSISVL